jgi:hypothetical protein
MSKTRPRLVFLAVAVWLSAAPAFGQDAAHVTVKLSVTEIAEILRLIDLQASSLKNPDAYFYLQLAIDKALQANPDAARAVLSIRSAHR